ncbi:MAG: hypothetical protein QGI68_07585 [Pseudomonadales bacterium]|jgi:hypothetical protein|nr:hypothetical protein [Pseudomonadales bacterium]MDP7595416.1 hypothetical protein [Pseudomonadales bacterium]HJN49649.1 hypothetical protein [Pseudomonadales bacterium]|tara:strand:+ start:2932 stop:3759 length:828 start_codon:yes stop_codon:yes gene_type:complete
MNLKTLIDKPPWEWPANADNTLLAVLTDDQAEADDRLAAAELAGDLVVINDELVDALLTILHDDEEAEALRSQAVIALGPLFEEMDVRFDDLDEPVITEIRFEQIKEALHQLYLDGETPEDVRRSILEASVRAQQEWHEDAVRAAYSNDDGLWQLTAVFCMRYVRGFEEQILEALDSTNAAIHFEAVGAAGTSEIDAAWSHVAALASSEKTEKPLLLASIDALIGIRPRQAGDVLGQLLDSEDEDISDAAYEALAMAEAMVEDADYDDEDDATIH